MDDKQKIVEVENTLQDAIEAAKRFHPVGKMYVNGYTGEVSQYKTPDNYVPDEGVKAGSPDLCHTEDFVTIAQMYQRLKAMKALSIQDSDFDFLEGDVSADDLDEDTLSDIVTEVDDPADYENYVLPFAEEKYGKSSEQGASDSAAAQGVTKQTKDEEARSNDEE